MIPTLVIGLREGVEASLIVGIIAAFLNHAGRRDALRQVWLGVGAAVLLCLAVGIGLFVLSRQGSSLVSAVHVAAVEAAVDVEVVGLLLEPDELDPVGGERCPKLAQKCGPPLGEFALSVA